MTEISGMTGMIGQILTVFMGLFAIMNPIANTPIFLGLTADDSPELRKKIAKKSTLLAFALVVVFCLLGKLIFDLFGITMPAFRITGGVLVAMIGYQMLQGESSSVHQPVSADNGDKGVDNEAALSIAVSPLAIPILAGPGTIAAAINFAATGSITDMVITIVAFAILCLMTYGFFVSGHPLIKYLGPNGLSAITRIMGLILAVIGVQMLIDGIAGAISMAQ